METFSITDNRLSNLQSKSLKTKQYIHTTHSTDIPLKAPVVQHQDLQRTAASLQTPSPDEPGLCVWPFGSVEEDNIDCN